MNKKEIIEMSNFEYNPKGFGDLKSALKSGKIVKNPFAKLYGEEVEVVIVRNEEFSPRIKQL